MIVPFTCAACARKFAPADGGKCRTCGGLFCLLHLTDTKNRDGPTCVTCDRPAPPGAPATERLT